MTYILITYSGQSRAPLGRLLALVRVGRNKRPLPHPSSFEALLQSFRAPSIRNVNYKDGSIQVPPFLILRYACKPTWNHLLPNYMKSLFLFKKKNDICQQKTITITEFSCSFLKTRKQKRNAQTTSLRLFNSRFLRAMCILALFSYRCCRSCGE